MVESLAESEEEVSTEDRSAVSSPTERQGDLDRAATHLKHVQEPLTTTEASSKVVRAMLVLGGVAAISVVTYVLARSRRVGSKPKANA